MAHTCMQQCEPDSTRCFLLQPNRISPLRKWWDPELVFTGVSIMTINPETGATDHRVLQRIIRLP